MKKFTHADIKLPEPKWNSSIIPKLMELARLQDKRLYTNNTAIFFELKNIFQDLENWASARIEGNQTELLDALSHDVSEDVSSSIGYQELRNLRHATRFIDEYLRDPANPIGTAFVLKVHKLVTENLPVGKNLPGDETPGKTRIKDVTIGKSDHVPPVGIKVKEYFEELMTFINQDHGKENDFFKVAIAHHRFTWVHPFTNGNGRVARLLTYAMLQKLGYGVERAHILNPSLVFYSDRPRYYDSLAMADKATNSGLLQWSEYFIEGLLEEITKIDRLLDGGYVKDFMLIPVVKRAYEAKRLSDDEYKILSHSFKDERMSFVSGNINAALGKELAPLARSRIITKMRKAGIIQPVFYAKQRYCISLTSGLMSRYIKDVLSEEGFINIPLHLQQSNTPSPE